MNHLVLSVLLLGSASAYTVRPGDTLFAIAQTHHTSVQALMDASGLRTALIHPGQQLTLPGALASTGRNAVTLSERVWPVYHIEGAQALALVRDLPAGTNAYTYAQQHGIDPLWFLSINKLGSVHLTRPARLVVGRILPPKAEVTIEQTVQTLPRIDLRWDDIAVQPGDTLSELAEEHGTTVEVLREANQLDGDLIIAGQRLSVPVE